MATYPLLLCSLKASPTWNSHSQRCNSVARHNYPEYATRDGFIHLPAVSYVRSTVLQAIRETNRLTDMDESRLRWRLFMPWDSEYDTVGRSSLLPDSRLHIFMENDDVSEPWSLVFTCPLIGPEFKAMPLVMQIAIEMLIRKECNGSDPE